MRPSYHLFGETRRFEQEGQTVSVTEVIAEDIVLLGGRSDSDSHGAPLPAQSTTRNSKGKGRSASPTENEEDLAATRRPDEVSF